MKRFAAFLTALTLTAMIAAYCWCSHGQAQFHAEARAAYIAAEMDDLDYATQSGIYK